MDKFYELLEKSVIVSGLLTLMLAGTCCYLFIIQAPIPELLGYFLTSVISFFFGSKVTSVAAARRM